MIIRTLFIALFLIFSISSRAQPLSGNNKESNNPLKGLPFKERVFIGGDLGLSFGTITYIRIAPLAGYNITPKLAAGVGVSYQYWKDKQYIPEFTSTIYGGSVFGRYFFLDNIFAETSFEVLNLEEIQYAGSIDQVPNRVTIPVWFVGAGYSQRIAGRSGIFIGIYYDLIQDINSPYPDNIAFRFGGYFGI